MLTPEIKALINGGALVVCNHSGGKDSQALYLYLRKHVPAAQLVTIHSHLDGVEWDGVEDHIRATIDGPLHVVRARRTFFEMVEHRGMWPDSQNRKCTSSLKAEPIKKKILELLRERANGDITRQVVINAMGLRAEESSNRAKIAPFEYHPKQSTRGNRKVAGRDWYQWLPIHELTKEEVFANIAAAGQEPHWAYKAGMTRLSCVFCIMSSDHDLRVAARFNPEAYRRYSEMERKLDHTLIMPSKKKGRRFLSDIVETSATEVEDEGPQLITDIPILPQPIHLDLVQAQAAARARRVRLLKLRIQRQYVD